MELVLTGALGGALSWLIEWGRAFALDLPDAGRILKRFGDGGEQLGLGRTVLGHQPPSFSNCSRSTSVSTATMCWA